MKTFLCDDTPESILTGIYEAFREPGPKDEITLELGSAAQFSLFTEQVRVVPSYEKAIRVMDTIHDRLGYQVHETVRGALCAASPDKAQALFQFLYYAFHRKGNVLHELTVPCVMRIFELDRKARGEAHKLLGFVRFEEVRPGVYYSTIGPVNDVLPLIADHFTARFNDQAFLIYDEKRRRAVVYTPGQNWYYQEGDFSLLSGTLKNSDRYEDLWKTFFDSTMIPERENRLCQRTLCPIHYRKYMLEFSTR